MVRSASSRADAPAADCAGVTRGLHAHRLGERSAEDVLPVAEADEQRAVERLLLDHLEAITGRDPTAAPGTAACPAR